MMRQILGAFFVILITCGSVFAAELTLSQKMTKDEFAKFAAWFDAEYFIDEPEFITVKKHVQSYSFSKDKNFKKNDDPIFMGTIIFFSDKASLDTKLKMSMEINKSAMEQNGTYEVTENKKGPAAYFIVEKKDASSAGEIVSWAIGWVNDDGYVVSMSIIDDEDVKEKYKNTIDRLIDLVKSGEMSDFLLYG